MLISYFGCESAPLVVSLPEEILLSLISFCSQSQQAKSVDTNIGEESLKILLSTQQKQYLHQKSQHLPTFYSPATLAGKLCEKNFWRASLCMSSNNEIVFEYKHEDYLNALNHYLQEAQSNKKHCHPIFSYIDSQFTFNQCFHLSNQGLIPAVLPCLATLYAISVTDTCSLICSHVLRWCSLKEVLACCSSESRMQFDILKAVISSFEDQSHTSNDGTAHNASNSIPEESVLLHFVSLLVVYFPDQLLPFLRKYAHLLPSEECISIFNNKPLVAADAFAFLLQRAGKRSQALKVLFASYEHTLRQTRKEMDSDLLSLAEVLVKPEGPAREEACARIACCERLRHLAECIADVCDSALLAAQDSETWFQAFDFLLATRRKPFRVRNKCTM